MIAAADVVAETRATTGPRLTRPALREISALLERWTGIRVANKEQMVEARLSPILRPLGLGFEDYVARVAAAGPQSTDAVAFINALTTNKTSFFREAHHFAYLQHELFPRLQQAALAGGSRSVRLWSAACSSGEEPYSLALLAAELLPAREGWDVKILATDIDTEVIERGRAAVYPRNDLATVPPSLARGLDPCDARGMIRIRPEVAGLVTFARANLTADPFPIRGRFHAIFCRNVMIYFERKVQDRLVDNLTASLAPGGVLVVGHSESLAVTRLARDGVAHGVYRAPDEQAAPAPDAPRPRPPVVRAPLVASPQPRRSRPRTTLSVHRITVGEIATSAEPRKLATLLGSCVSACLYDPVAKIGGLNHFLLPANDADRTARYGVHAMELLINKLMRLGAQRDRLVAKVFGAGQMTPAPLTPIAELNAAFIRAYLEREQIPIVAERLGGTRARYIQLDTADGSVAVREIEATSSVLERELHVATTNTAVSAATFAVDSALF